MSYILTRIIIIVRKCQFQALIFICDMHRVHVHVHVHAFMHATDYVEIVQHPISYYTIIIEPFFDGFKIALCTMYCTCIDIIIIDGVFSTTKDCWIL